MTKLSLAFRAMGAQFSPGQVEQGSGALFSEKNEPGDIARTGRYRGQPLPYGSAEIRDADTPMTLSAGQSPFIDAVARVAAACRSAGATSLVVHADVAYYGQCNFELSENCIARLAALGVALTFTCFEDNAMRE